MSSLKSRLKQLAQVQSQIFGNVLNPNNQRNGLKYLSKSLRGPSLINYYGNPDFIKFKNLKTIFPGAKFTDPEEQYRLSMVRFKKTRGKGAPKKSKEPKAKGHKK